MAEHINVYKARGTSTCAVCSGLPIKEEMGSLHSRDDDASGEQAVRGQCPWSTMGRVEAHCRRQSAPLLLFRMTHQSRRGSRHLFDVYGVGEQHSQAVDAHAPAACGRQAILQGSTEVLVHIHGLHVSPSLCLRMTAMSDVTVKQIVTFLHVMHPRVRECKAFKLLDCS